MSKPTQAEKKNSYMHVYQAPKQIMWMEKKYDLKFEAVKNLPKFGGPSNAHHEHHLIPWNSSKLTIMEQSSVRHETKF